MGLLNLSDFDYELPRELIAQTPAKERDQSRLLILDKDSRKIAHGKFSVDGKEYTLFCNNSPGDIPCALHGGKGGFDKVLWDAEPFAEKYPRLVAEVEECFAEGERLSHLIRANLQRVEASDRT